MSEQVFNITQADNVKLVGGKALSLGKMLRAGINVPSGFVLSAETFMSMTPKLEKLIIANFDKLQTGFVAVRSSAVNEDSLDHAWAGQLDTFLNCTRDDLLANIQACWASANSRRALSYARQNAIHGTKVAVIVQEMIQGDVSGIAFSAHPVSSNDAQVVIEAGFGLGEAIVSGQVTPDTYIVDKKTGELIEKNVSDQSKMLVRNAEGETTWKDLGARGTSQKLTDKQITELCKLTKQLEVFFKYPVDVEWTIRKDSVYILQSRPITTITH